MVEKIPRKNYLINYKIQNDKNNLILFKNIISQKKIQDNIQYKKKMIKIE